MISADAQQRYRIVCFWEKHGLLATQEAFGVSRRTLYAWRQRLHAGGVCALKYTAAPLAPTALARRTAG
ncbi:helix-turn-helix domain-containing protein [Dyella jejuensis]|uniref:Helix-turn-helix domain-containing protein n=1 Tax=Dyella jejuensis TaxID=1432009 RepID=A0ABW8JJP9_9GAMM